jgi:hypothetical protein
MGSSVGRSVGAALRAAFGGQTVGRDGLRGGLERIHSDGTSDYDRTQKHIEALTGQADNKNKK